MGAAGHQGRRLLIILVCSVGVRSASAASLLRRRGLAAVSLEDGWLGNDMGPGLRQLTQAR